MGEASRILIVEDEPMVAAELAAMIEDIGLVPVGPYATVEAASAALAEQRVDAAVLDFLLRKEESFPVAERLRAMRIPFVLATAWPLDRLPRHWDGCPILTKPLRRESLSEILANLVRQKAGYF